MSITPIEIKRIKGDGLSIVWSDGRHQSLSNIILRERCPCAFCREARGDESHSKPLTGKKSPFTILKTTKEEETDLQEVWAVGNYAIGIRWGDNHNSGIYTFAYLYELI
jgi:DUF971 family protein